MQTEMQNILRTVDDKKDVNFSQLTQGNLARWKRCSFLRQGSYRSTWHWHGSDKTLSLSIRRRQRSR